MVGRGEGDCVGGRVGGRDCAIRKDGLVGLSRKGCAPGPGGSVSLNARELGEEEGEGECTRRSLL